MDLVGDEDGWIPLSASLSRLREPNGLQPDTSYRFRTVAINSVGASGYSPEVQVDTVLPPLPLAPTELLQTEIWATYSAIRWSPPPTTVPILGYEVELRDKTAGGEFVPYAQLEATQLVLDPLDQGNTYEVRVRAANIVGTGEWAVLESLFTMGHGQCASDEDARVWNENQGSFTQDMGDCCGTCLGNAACFTSCWSDRLAYTEGCTQCWAGTCTCSGTVCLVPCLPVVGNPEECNRCVIENCTPETEACTGIPGEYIPTG